MQTVYDKMEYCLAGADRQGQNSFERIVAFLSDGSWRVRYAAAVALGDRRDPKAVEPLLKALQKEIGEPLFSQPPLEGGAHAGSNSPFSVKFPEGTTEDTKEAWRRRGRLLQAICLALGSIGISSPEVLEILHRLATDQGCDYGVRAAACKALGQIASKDSIPILEKAAADEEWCTKTEAKKALRRY